MFAASVVAALAFSAPPSSKLSRRDMMVGVGPAFAAAAAMVQFPAFAADQTEYAKIVEASKVNEAAEAKRKAEFMATINSDSNLAAVKPNLRKPSDPNACSEVRVHPVILVCPLKCE